jgi:hypothetical protein
MIKFLGPSNRPHSRIDTGRFQTTADHGVGPLAHESIAYVAPGLPERMIDNDAKNVFSPPSSVIQPCASRPHL